MAKKTTKQKTARRSRLSKPKKKQLGIDITKLPILADPTLRSAWVDRMTIAVRAEVPVATLGFYTFVTDSLREAAVLQTSVAHLKNMVDVLCRTIDYYPKKPSK